MKLIAVLLLFALTSTVAAAHVQGSAGLVHGFAHPFFCGALLGRGVLLPLVDPMVAVSVLVFAAALIAGPYIRLPLSAGRLQPA